MAETEKARGKEPPQPAERAGHETVDAPFDDIIDAILGADPAKVREHQESWRNKQKKFSGKN